MAYGEDSIDVALRARVPVVPTETNEHNALARVQDNFKYRPLNALVTLDTAILAEEHLKRGAENLNANSRALCYKVISWWLTEGNYKYSNHKMCAILGINRVTFEALTRRWPGFWGFYTTLAAQRAKEMMGRIEQATAEAAIHGNERDRRLYLELQGRLKQKEETKHANFIFINDQLTRPNEGQSSTPVEASSVVDVQFDSD